MRDRLLGEEVWRNIGFDAAECASYIVASPFQREYQRRLFSRIVPTLKDIGIWGARIRGAFADMGVLQMGDYNFEERMQADEDVAAEFEKLLAARGAEIERTLALARGENA